MKENKFSISEVAKEVAVENHVLRYWEEELQLEIKRNQSGHRYYTRENIDEFLRIKELKENGLQLKAIRMVLFQTTVDKQGTELPKEVAAVSQELVTIQVPSSDDKVLKIQQLLSQIMGEVVRENNEQLCKEVKDSVVKELDYQFRLRDEVEEQREIKRLEREEAHYQRIDEALRGKMAKKEKRKKHSFF